MRRAVRRAAVLVMVGLVGMLVAAVGVAAARNEPDPDGATVSDQRQREIAAAAAEFGVPAPLLVALSGALSGFGAGSDPAVDGGTGLFRLADGAAALDGRGGADSRGARVRAAAGADPATRTLTAAARLAGRSPAQVRDTPAEAARAAAALLRSYALEATGGTLPGSVVGWYGAVARFATGDAMTGRAVADDVYALLRRGVPATVVDGERFAVMPPARDYKRLRDDDQGPNTGGMGSHAPVHDLDPDVMARVRQSVLEPAVAGLRAEGRPYRGALYAGLMLTREGPMALEFNCRFGDPETQVMLPLLDPDLAELLLACAEGRLATESIATLSDVAVCVVLAAEGYPERPRAGDPIYGIEDAIQTGALIFHAGTATCDGQLVTNGGRVLSVVGTGANLVGAAAHAYVAADMIRFDGMQLRRDVALSLVAQPV